LLVKILDELISPIREKREYYKDNMDLVINSVERGSQNVREI